MSTHLTPAQSKRRPIAILLAIAGMALSVAFTVIFHETASQPFTATLTDPNALPKELVVTSRDVKVPLPAVGEDPNQDTTTTTQAPPTTAPAQTDTSVATIPTARVGSVFGPERRTTVTSGPTASPSSTTPTTQAAAPVTSAPTPTTAPADQNSDGQSSSTSMIDVTALFGGVR